MRKRTKTVFALVACAAFILAFLLSVRVGSTRLSLREFFGGFFMQEGYEKISFVVWNLRIPRTVCACLAGVGLSLSGVALQNLTGNDLAGPNIIGVNAGAGFFVIAGMYFLKDFMTLMPIFAFFGAFLASLVILMIGGALADRRNAIILAGVALTALLNAGISLISLLDTDILAAYTDFSVGGLSGGTLNKVVLPAVMIGVSAVIILYFSKDIDAMMLGDEIARSLGVNTRLTRMAVILASSAAAGAVVSFAGLLGFVGLMVPHMARRIFGIGTKDAAVGSALLGAIIVLLADTIGRSAFRGTEVPVGIVMAFVGVPFFLYLIFRRRAA